MGQSTSSDEHYWIPNPVRQKSYRESYQENFYKYNVVSDERIPRPSETSVWGPMKWHQLHVMTLSYPDRPTHVDEYEFQKDMGHFMKSLPCIVCQQHIMEYVQKYPIPMDSSLSMQTWAWKFHNFVNNRTWREGRNEGKPKYIKMRTPLYFTEKDYYAKYPTGKIDSSRDDMVRSLFGM